MNETDSRSEIRLDTLLSLIHFLLLAGDFATCRGITCIFDFM